MAPYNLHAGWGDQQLTASSLRSVMPLSETTMMRLLLAQPTLRTGWRYNRASGRDETYSMLLVLYMGNTSPIRCPR